MTDATPEGPHRETPTPPVPARRTFAALQHRPFLLLFVSGLFMFVSVQGQQVVRGWLAAELTGSNSGLGGVFFGFAIPMLLLTPFGGVAADRFPKRLVLLLSTGVLVLSALWVGLADAFGVLEYWMLVGASALQAGGFAIFGPARIAMTGEVVPSRDLTNAMVLSQIGNNSSRIVGPAAAGALIGVPAIGTAGSYLITAGLMAVSLLIMVFLPRGASSDPDTRRSPLVEFREGISYVRQNRQIGLLLLFCYAIILLGFPYLVFLPLVAADLFDLGASAYGIMSAVGGAAAVVVSLWIARRDELDPWKVQFAGAAAFSVGIVGLGVAPTFPLALVVLAVLGAGGAVFQAMNNTLILIESDLAYHGRVQSLLMLSFSGFGLAALPLGGVADTVGLRPTFVGMGTAAIAATVVYGLARRHLVATRRLDLG